MSLKPLASPSSTNKRERAAAQAALYIARKKRLARIAANQV